MSSTNTSDQDNEEIKRLQKWDARFISLARHVSTWSKDPSTRVGAIISNGVYIVSVGFNGLPAGVKDLESRYENTSLKYKMIIHAERNAMILAETSLAGCTIYTYPYMPCAPCASMVIQSGIVRVVSMKYTLDDEHYKEDFVTAMSMLSEADVELTLYDLPESEKV